MTRACATNCWPRWSARADGEDPVACCALQGETFCAGADLERSAASFLACRARRGQAETGKPLIAVVQGPVVGLALTIVAYADLCGR